MTSASIPRAWEVEAVSVAARSRIRHTLGLPASDRPTYERVDIGWTPDRWLADIGDGAVASLLESTAGPDDVSHWSVFAIRPRFVLTAPDGQTTLVFSPAGASSDVRTGGHSQPPDDAFDLGMVDVIDALTTPVRGAPDPTEPPFRGGLIGYLAYDAGHWFERLPAHAARDIATPLAAFAYYDRALAHHHPSATTYLVRSDPDVDAGGWLESLTHPAPEPGTSPTASLGDAAPTSATDNTSAPSDATADAARPGPDRHAPGAPVRVDWEAARWNVERDAYLDMVQRARDYIFAGDIFEVCLSRRFSMPFTGPPSGVYASLRERSPSPFAAFCGFADHAVISSSPERFLTHDGARLETRPIKGTSRRADDPAANQLVMEEMAADRKQRAEHLMIVDLSRSDLSRVCGPGTVKVPALARTETYSHVNHLVSVIEGRPPATLTFRQAMGAAFPGGSITGAPKVRSMEVIDELEPVARGAYTGSIGYVSVDGRFDLSIAIRTLVAIDGELHGQVGGAIVAASDPAAEWQETEDKAAGMLAALADLA